DVPAAAGPGGEIAGDGLDVGLVDVGQGVAGVRDQDGEAGDGFAHVLVRARAELGLAVQLEGEVGFVAAGVVADAVPAHGERVVPREGGGGGLAVGADLGLDDGAGVGDVGHDAWEEGVGVAGGGVEVLDVDHAGSPWCSSAWRRIHFSAVQAVVQRGARAPHSQTGRNLGSVMVISSSAVIGSSRR